MILCRVLGSIVATAHHRHYDGRKVLAVAPVDPRDPYGKPVADDFISIDVTQAGPGDLVIVNKEGGSSRIAVDLEDGAVHSTIVAIVDEIQLINEASR